MFRNIKATGLLVYFIAAIFLSETILRVLTTGGLLSAGLGFSLLFSLSFACLGYIFCTLFPGRASYLLSTLLLGLLAFIFSSQLIYYKFFKTFYSMYSVGNAGQILDFWQDILAVSAQNWPLIVLIFLPVIAMTAVGWKMFTFKQLNRISRTLLLGLIILIHLTGLAAVYAGGKKQNSAYDLYFNSNYPILSVQKLGLLTTMRLDLQRSTFGWSAMASGVTPAGPPSNPADSYENKTPAETVEYNTMNINFSDLIAAENNDIIKNSLNYLSRVQPTAKNNFTGLYKGYNLIFITAEAFSPYAVREDVTPTLYKLLHEGYNFTNFYTPIWELSTSDGEYVACTGLLPKSGVWSFAESGKISMPFVLGNQLKKLGYKTVAYHDHTYTYYKRNISHPNMGYAYKGVGKGLNVKKTWPESDLEMMQKTVSEYVNNQPFHAYYMTVSGHLRYTFTGNAMALKNKKYVESLPYSDAAKAYIAAQIELDRAMKYLLEQLDKAGVADKTLIALSADHYPYGLEDQVIDELAGHQVERNFELYKNYFILYTKGMKPVTVDKPASSLDIIPTLSNLLGLKYDSRLLMGRDLFSDSEPLVMFLNRSFITDKGRYNAVTKEFTPREGIEVGEDYVDSISDQVNAKFYYSAKILETNLYQKLMQEQ